MLCLRIVQTFLNFMPGTTRPGRLPQSATAYKTVSLSVRL